MPTFDAVTTPDDEFPTPFSDEDNARRVGWQKPKVWGKGTDVRENSGISQALPQFDETSDLYLMYNPGLSECNFNP